MGQFEGGQVGKTKDMNWKKEIDRQRKIWLNYVARVRVSLKDEGKCGAITPTSRIELLRLLDLDLHFTLILIPSNAMTHRIGIDVLPG